MRSTKWFFVIVFAFVSLFTAEAYADCWGTCTILDTVGNPTQEIYSITAADRSGVRDQCYEYAGERAYNITVQCNDGQ